MYTLLFSLLISTYLSQLAVLNSNHTSPKGLLILNSKMHPFMLTAGAIKYMVDFPEVWELNLRCNLKNFTHLFKVILRKIRNILLMNFGTLFYG